MPVIAGIAGLGALGGGGGSSSGSTSTSFLNNSTTFTENSSLKGRANERHWKFMMRNEKACTTMKIYESKVRIQKSQGIKGNLWKHENYEEIMTCTEIAW